jgi:hypothetical protein
MKLIGFIQHRSFLPRTRFHENSERPAHIVRIRSIEYIGEEPVYDISCSSENFVAGGMLCHNTGTPQAMIGGLVGGHSGGGGPMMMGGSGGGGTVQMRFDPNPSSISVPYDTQSRGFNYVPAYYISKRVNICITSQYTISQSRGAGGTVSYSCRSGQITSGDALGGREWGNSPLQAEVPSLSPQYNPKSKGFFREESKGF